MQQLHDLGKLHQLHQRTTQQRYGEDMLTQSAPVLPAPGHHQCTSEAKAARGCENVMNYTRAVESSMACLFTLLPADSQSENERVARGDVLFP